MAPYVEGTTEISVTVSEISRGYTSSNPRRKKRTVYELEVGDNNFDDPWATAAPASGARSGGAGGAGGGASSSSFDDEPPF